MAKLTKEQKQQVDAWWDSLTNDEKRLFQIIRRATYLGMIDAGINYSSLNDKEKNYIPEIIPHEEA